MPEQRFTALRLELLRGGVAPVYVERMLLELEEHFADLEADSLAAGVTPTEAAQRARSALGEERAIAAAVLSRPELLAWNVRWPRLASCLRSVATVGTWPGVPLVYCIEHGADIGRWSAAFAAATGLVGGMLGWLNWMIILE